MKVKGRISRSQASRRRVIFMTLPYFEELSHPPTPHYVKRLQNDGGWLFCYEITGEGVIVSRSFKGQPVSGMLMDVAAAKIHYRNLRRQGFKRS